MMRRQSAVILILILVVQLSFALPAGGIEITTGHQKEIIALEYDEERGQLFSGSKDGTVKIWRPQDASIVHSLLVSHLAIDRIAIHPTLPQIAILEVYGSDSARICVWDWERKIQLDSINLNETPLYMSYSPKGTYLVSCRADWQSLKFYDALSGKTLNIMKRGFGIVSFFTLAQSEKNIMTYQPSGRITYWELHTGKQLKTIETLSNLSSIKITKNGRFMIAQSENKLVAIDLLSGQVKGSVPLPGIVSITLSETGDTITCLSREDNQVRISCWHFTGNLILSASSPPAGRQSDDYAIMAEGDGKLFFGDTSGRIWTQSRYGEASLFSYNNLLSISGFTVHENKISLAGSGKILTFTLDLKTRFPHTDDLINNYSFTLYDNPFSNQAGIEYRDERQIIVWDNSHQLSGITTLDTTTGQLGQTYSGISSQLFQVSLSGDNLITLERNGSLKILDSEDYTTVFEYSSPGMKKIVPVGEDTLIGARNKTAQFTGSLIRINARTGETIPISSTSLLAYDLAYDAVRDYLYSLSVERIKSRSTAAVTTVKQHYGSDYGTNRTIMQYPGEDLTACLFMDSRRNELFTSLGYSSVRVWNGRTINTFQESGHIPRSIRITDKLVFALNMDCTVTLWDRSTRMVIATLYIFDDLNWAAVFPNQNSYVSSNANQYLIVPGHE